MEIKSFEFCKKNWRPILLIVLLEILLINLPSLMLAMIAGSNRELLQIFLPLLWALVTLPISINMYGALLDIGKGEEISYGKIIKGSYLPMKESYGIGLIQTLYTILWGLLFIIPAIVKSIAYSLSTFIRIVEPNTSANEAITKSRSLMDGHKWDFFTKTLIIVIPYFVLTYLLEGLNGIVGLSFSVVLDSLFTMGLMIISFRVFKKLYKGIAN